MGIKVFAAVMSGFFALSGATCEKSGSEDPTKEKPGPDPAVISLEGVDTGPLTPREKKEWSQYVSEFLSPCPNVPVPIAQCVKEKRDCNRCLPAAKHVLKGVKDGMSREQIEKTYKNRFDPAMVKNVPVDGSPTKGPEGAPITIVDWGIHIGSDRLMPAGPHTQRTPSLKNRIRPNVPSTWSRWSRP